MSYFNTLIHGYQNAQGFSGFYGVETSVSVIAKKLCVFSGHAGLLQCSCTKVLWMGFSMVTKTFWMFARELVCEILLVARPSQRGTLLMII